MNKNADSGLRRAIILLLGTLALFGIGFAYPSLKLAFSSIISPSTQIPPNSDFEVRYTTHGFVPSFLEVSLGSRVTFRNTTDLPMWPASDPYPTHTDYPEFNAHKAYHAGEVYVFQFTRSGTFGYDNDTKIIDHGTIRISDPSHPVQEISLLTQSQKLQRDRLLALFKPGDPNSVFTIIDTIQADQTLSLNCHEITHDLGHRAYELYGFSGAMTFSNPNRLSHVSVEDICAGGYVHGVLEELFLHQPELQNQPGIMCSNVPSANRASCFHGVGHALMFVNKRDVAASVTACRSLSSPTDASRCFEGVWMELFWGSTEHAGPNSLGWDPKNPLAPCIATQTDAKPACFLYSSFGYLRTHPKDYTGAIQLCTTSALKESDTEFCLKGVGITMMSHFKSHHLESSEPFVAGLGFWQKLAFYQGVLGYARLSGISESELTNTCNVLMHDKDICITALTDSL